MLHAFRLRDDLHELWLSRTPRGYELHLGTRRLAVALHGRGEQVHELVVGDRAQRVHLAVHGDEVHVHLDGEAHVLRHVDSLERFAAEAQDGGDAAARAPMPGAVIAVRVQPGQAVQRGEVLVVIESMKMETAICATVDGTVQALHVEVGQTFERDALLVSLAPHEVAA